VSINDDAQNGLCGITFHAGSANLCQRADPLPLTWNGGIFHITVSLQTVVFSSQRHLWCYDDQSINYMWRCDAMHYIAPQTAATGRPTEVMTLGWPSDLCRRPPSPCFVIFDLGCYCLPDIYIEATWHRSKRVYKVHQFNAVVRRTQMRPGVQVDINKCSMALEMLPVTPSATGMYSSTPRSTLGDSISKTRRCRYFSFYFSSAGDLLRRRWWSLRWLRRWHTLRCHTPSQLSDTRWACDTTYYDFRTTTMRYDLSHPRTGHCRSEKPET